MRFFRVAVHMVTTYNSCSVEKTREIFSKINDGSNHPIYKRTDLAMDGPFTVHSICGKLTKGLISFLSRTWPRIGNSSRIFFFQKIKIILVRVPVRIPEAVQRAGPIRPVRAPRTSESRGCHVARTRTCLGPTWCSHLPRAGPTVPALIPNSQFNEKPDDHSTNWAPHVSRPDKIIMSLNPFTKYA